MNSRKSIWLVSATMLAIILSSCNLGATPAPAQDPGAVQTQAFNSVMTLAALQQTQTSMAVPPTALPTNTLQPTNTLVGLPTFAPVGGTSTPFGFNPQQPGFTPLALVSPVPTGGIVSTITTKNGCNDGLYIGETHPFDNEEVDLGKVFAKTWTIMNTGTCPWDEGYVFVFLTDLSSPEIKGYNIVLRKNKPEDYTDPGHTQSYKVDIKAPNKPGTYKGFWKLRDDGGNFFGPLVSLWVVVVD